MGDEQDQGAKPGKDPPQGGKPDGGKGAGKDESKPPEPPGWLPLPKDFRDVLDCTRDSVKLAGAGVATNVDGVTVGFGEYGEKDPKKKKGHFKITFKGLKDKMSLDVPDPLELDASIDKDGQFHIHVHDDPNVPKPLKKGIRDYVQAVNRFLGGKGKKLGPPGSHGGNLELEKVAVTSALHGDKTGTGFLAYLPTWEKVGGGVAIVALVVGGFALMGAGDSTTTETKQVAAGGGPSSPSEQLPDQSQNVKNGFPTGVPVTDVMCASDPAGDWNFFNGQEPGRHDKFVDIRRVCEGRIDVSDPGSDVRKVLDGLEEQLSCGAGEGSLVVCSPSPRPIPAEPLDVFSARLNGDFPLINKPGEQGRLSLFIDGGGDPSTKAVASDRSPNLALAGTNVFRELIIGNPGLPPGQPDPPSVLLNAVDRRQADEFLKSPSRIWVHAPYVTWIVPEREIGPDFAGARFATLWGSSTADQGGDATFNNADVAPGGVDAPFGLLMPDAAPTPEPGPSPEPETVTRTEETDDPPYLPVGGLALAAACLGGLVVDNERRRHWLVAGGAPGFSGGEPARRRVWGLGAQPTIDESAQTLHDQWAETYGSGAKSDYDAGPLKPSFAGKKLPEPEPTDEEPSTDDAKVEQPDIPPAEDLSPKPYRPPPDVM